MGGFGRSAKNMTSKRINFHRDLFGSEAAKDANLKLLWTVLAITVFWSLTTMCMCSHFDEITLIGTSIGAIIGWRSYILGKRQGFLVCCSAIVPISILTFLLLKNLGDIFWF